MYVAAQIACVFLSIGGGLYALWLLGDCYLAARSRTTRNKPADRAERMSVSTRVNWLLQFSLAGIFVVVAGMVVTSMASRHLTQGIPFEAGSLCSAQVPGMSALPPGRLFFDHTRPGRPLVGADLADLPITDADVADFEKLLTPDTRKWYAETPLDLKIPSIQHGMRGMLHFLFASGSPDLKDLVTAEELNEFEKSLPPDRRDSLARLPAEMRSGQLRFSYFLSKLPEHLRGERDGRYSSGRGGPPHGDQRHDGPPEFRRGPRNDLRDRGDEPPPGPMRPDRPGMQPPPGEMRPDRPGRRSPPGEGPGEEPE